jgi:hypothetical protein
MGLGTSGWQSESVENDADQAQDGVEQRSLFSGAHWLGRRGAQGPTDGPVRQLGIQDFIQDSVRNRALPDATGRTTARQSPW